MAEGPAFTYQPALDGVRALAVVAVLLFHAEVTGFDGGYLGVSVFFTLSGFLITSLLVREREDRGRIDVGAFYVRRARRLLPASLVCLAAVVVISATTDAFIGVTALRQHVLGSLFQVANWVFLAGDDSYQELFERSAGAVSPLEHYWSLAIEEQFYWVWPLAFAGVASLAATHHRRTWSIVALTAAFAVAAPVIAAVWGPDAAYWATPARIAEILVGAALAMILADRGDRLDPRLGWLAPLALVGLAAMVVTFPAAGGPAYSGALPLVALVSGALLLGLQVDGPVRSSLSWGPVVWLGGISYGVYLYHWPIYVLIDDTRTDLDGPALVAVRLAVTLVIAQLSMWLVERPVRRGRPVPRRAVLAGALSTTAVVAVATIALVPAASSDYWRGSEVTAEAAAIDVDAELVPLVADDPAPSTGAPSADAEAVDEPADGSDTGPADVDGTDADAADGADGAGDAGATDDGDPAAGTTESASESTMPEPAAGEGSGVEGDGDPIAASPGDDELAATTTLAAIPDLARPVRIVVAGDSTAEATGAGLLSWAADHPDVAQVEVHAVPGCGFVRGGEILVEDWQVVDPGCERWTFEVLTELMADLRPDVVMMMTTSWDVLDRRWDGGPTLGPADEPYRARIDADFAAATATLLDGGAATIAWIEQPVPNVFWLGSGQVQEDPARHAVLHDAMGAIAAGERRVDTIDLDGWMSSTGLDTDQDARPDGVHWSPESSQLVADEFLGDALVRVALGLGAPD